MTIIPLPGPAFIAGGSGYGEIIVIFVVVLLLFGPKRLPEVARMIGRAFDELRKASQEFKDQIMAIESEARDTARDAIEAAVHGSDDKKDDYEDDDDDEEDPESGYAERGQDETDKTRQVVDETRPGHGTDLTEAPDRTGADTETKPSPPDEAEDDERTRPLAG